MYLAVRQTLLLVVTMPEERFLAFGADKMLDVPMFAESGHDAFLDRTTASAANWDTHLVMATKTVELIHVIGRKARSAPHLPGVLVQLYPALGAVEMVRMVNLSAELQRLIIDNSMALIANVFAQPFSFQFRVTLMA